MADDLFEKAVFIGLGLEKKAKEVLDELEKIAKAGGEGAVTPEGEKLSARQVLENRVVEDGVKALKEFLSVIHGAKEKLEEEVASSSGKIREKMHIASQDDIDVIKEMARVAREKVDRLEKRVDELQAKFGKGN
jgi:BMFP domain-containing protein YqiC